MAVTTNVSAAELAERWNADGEFRLAARYWNGSFALDATGELRTFTVEAGVIRPGEIRADAHIGLRAAVDVWAKILAAIPPPLFNDILPARAFGLELDGPAETFWQYYPAVRRAVELLREGVQ